MNIFLKQPNEQHRSIKLDCKVLKEEIAFLETLVYINQIKKIQTTIYWKETDRQTLLHSKLEHRLSLKSRTYLIVKL